MRVFSLACATMLVQIDLSAAATDPPTSADGNGWAEEAVFDGVSQAKEFLSSAFSLLKGDADKTVVSAVSTTSKVAMQQKYISLRAKINDPNYGCTVDPTQMYDYVGCYHNTAGTRGVASIHTWYADNNKVMTFDECRQYAVEKNSYQFMLEHTNTPNKGKWRTSVCILMSAGDIRGLGVGSENCGTTHTERDDYGRIMGGWNNGALYTNGLYTTFMPKKWQEICKKATNQECLTDENLKYKPFRAYHGQIEVARCMLRPKVEIAQREIAYDPTVHGECKPTSNVPQYWGFLDYFSGGDLDLDTVKFKGRPPYYIWNQCYINGISGPIRDSCFWPEVKELCGDQKTRDGCGSVSGTSTPVVPSLSVWSINRRGATAKDAQRTWYSNYETPARTSWGACSEVQTKNKLYYRVGSQKNHGFFSIGSRPSCGSSKYHQAPIWKEGREKITNIQCAWIPKSEWSSAPTNSPTTKAPTSPTEAPTLAPTTALSTCVEDSKSWAAEFKVSSSKHLRRTKVNQGFTCAMLRMEAEMMMSAEGPGSMQGEMFAEDLGAQILSVSCLDMIGHDLYAYQACCKTCKEFHPEYVPETPTETPTTSPTAPTSPAPVVNVKTSVCSNGLSKSQATNIFKAAYAGATVTGVQPKACAATAAAARRLSDVSSSGWKAVLTITGIAGQQPADLVRIVEQRKTVEPTMMTKMKNEAQKETGETITVEAIEAPIILPVSYEICRPKACSSWDCADWCKCFEESNVELYSANGCFDDGDPCVCA
jgi:hypothetical protein